MSFDSDHGLKYVEVHSVSQGMLGVFGVSHLAHKWEMGTGLIHPLRPLLQEPNSSLILSVGPCHDLYD